jgi:hypothetical protein
MSITSSLKMEAGYVPNREINSEWEGEFISYFGVG